MAFTDKDARQYQTPIARRKITIAVVSDTGDISVMPINGELLNYVIVAPNLTTDTDYDFTISNDDSESVYTNTGIADNSTVTTLVSDKPVPMAGTMTFQISFTTSQTASFDIYLYYK